MLDIALDIDRFTIIAIAKYSAKSKYQILHIINCFRIEYYRKLATHNMITYFLGNVKSEKIFFASFLKKVRKSIDICKIGVI